jgi:ABC transporter substrate binding protein
MRRREFIAILAAASASSIMWPLAARAQQSERMRRIGVLMAHPEGDPEFQDYVGAFRDALRNLGWIEGRNIRFDFRWGALDDAEMRRRSAQELVALRPHLILTQNTPPSASMLQQTRTIPVIFVVVADPVGSGFVKSLSRPGGNATGFTIMEPTIAGKWVELLKGIAPGITRTFVQPDDSPLRRRLYKTFPSCGDFHWVGGYGNTCSRCLRARIRDCCTGAPARWRLGCDPRWIFECSSLRDRFAGRSLRPACYLSVAFFRGGRWPLVLRS